MRKIGVRRAVATVAAIAGTAAFLPLGAARADGTETLGPPSIPIAAGTGIVSDGVGLMNIQPGTINLNVPANAEVKQVLAYWEGESRSNPDNTLEVNGVDVTGTLIGGPTVFFYDNGPVSSSSYRADITGLNVVHPGANTISVAGLHFDYANDGASIAVIYDDHSGPAVVQVRDGNDNAWKYFDPPTNDTVPQTFTVAPAAFDRVAKVDVVVGSVDVNRPTNVVISSGGVSTNYPNVLHNTDGAEWDDVVLNATIPANATTVTVHVQSEDVTGSGVSPASLTWVAAFLSTGGPGGTCPPLSSTPATTHGSAYGVDARVLGGLINVDKFPKVASAAPAGPANDAKVPVSVNVGTLVNANVLATASHSKLNPSVSTSTASLANVSLLGGLVRATAVRGVSQSVASPFSASYNSNGSAIVGLTVSGAPVVVAPNTKLKVKLLGLDLADLYVYEESGSSTYANGVSKSAHSVNMLRLVLLRSYGLYPAGTQVVLSHAQSDAQSPMSGCPDAKSVSGEAFTAYVDGDLAGKDLVDLKVGSAVLPATGGSNSDGTVAYVPGVVTSLTATNTTAGTLNPNPAATSRSIVEGVNVLNGLVTARVLDVKATSSANGTTAGTALSATFVDLTVGKTAISANVGPNSTIHVDLGSLGYASVVLNEQVTNTSGGTDTAGTVNAVHVRLYTLGGLFKGEVIVASAHSDAHL